MHVQYVCALRAPHTYTRERQREGTFWTVCMRMRRSIQGVKCNTMQGDALHAHDDDDDDDEMGQARVFAPLPPCL